MAARSTPVPSACPPTPASACGMWTSAASRLGSRSMSPPQHRLPADAAADLRALLDPIAPAVAEARAVADCPTGCVPLPELLEDRGLPTFVGSAVVKSVLYPLLVLQAD